MEDLCTGSLPRSQHLVLRCSPPGGGINGQLSPAGLAILGGGLATARPFNQVSTVPQLRGMPCSSLATSQPNGFLYYLPKIYHKNNVSSNSKLLCCHFAQPIMITESSVAWRVMRACPPPSRDIRRSEGSVYVITDSHVLKLGFVFSATVNHFLGLRLNEKRSGLR